MLAIQPYSFKSNALNHANNLTGTRNKVCALSKSHQEKTSYSTLYKQQNSKIDKDKISSFYKYLSTRVPQNAMRAFVDVSDYFQGNINKGVFIDKYLLTLNLVSLKYSDNRKLKEYIEYLNEFDLAYKIGNLCYEYLCERNDDKFDSELEQLTIMYSHNFHHHH